VNCHFVFLMAAALVAGCQTMLGRQARSGLQLAPRLLPKLQSLGSVVAMRPTLHSQREGAGKAGLCFVVMAGCWEPLSQASTSNGRQPVT